MDSNFASQLANLCANAPKAIVVGVGGGHADAAVLGPPILYRDA